MPDPEGQSPETREWVARRAKADRAIESVRRQTARNETSKQDEDERRVNENPMLLIAGIVLAAILIIGGLWWFIAQVECDPLISDRAFSSMCR